MGLLNNGITIMNFDETYISQKELQQFPHENINIQHLLHVNLFCQDDSLKLLKSNLEKRKQKGITLIGNGNYHYVTYLLLSEICQPFTLVLFDNHPDLEIKQKGETILSCGSWVSFALANNPLLKNVVIIGPTNIKLHHLNVPRTIIYIFNKNQQYSLKSIISSIHTEIVYVSIDKDVLNTNEVTTNWDQGMMNIHSLTHYLSSILQAKQVIGVDICGEVKMSPEQVLLPNYQTIIKKNAMVNRQLLTTCLKYSNCKTKGA
ncbi:arginase family protein [Heyndrickxia oleronia]|uniref:Arginase family protein n=1 Tax=Heyndrickxia oleronia TaxID=38875 RepID=A0AAW6SUI6_9BACI|nr:arginase family protein [Heyndrickxia oleronia]MDH5162475.1 arginase family protein [Heyndrickxia oleronia]